MRILKFMFVYIMCVRALRGFILFFYYICTLINIILKALSGALRGFQSINHVAESLQKDTTSIGIRGMAIKKLVR